MRSHPLLPVYNSGEISPRLLARTDLQKYRNAGEIVENWIPTIEGPLMRRSGSRYVAEVKNSANVARLKRFEFSTQQAYMLEMGAGYIRFYRNQGQITVDETDAAITNGDFTSDITGWDDISTGNGSIAHNSTGWPATVLGLVPGGTGGSDAAIAEQDVATTATDQEHVLKFRVYGAPGDKIRVRIGSSTGASDILAGTDRGPGFHCIAFTPDASPFYVQFANFGGVNNKTLGIDDVSLIDGAAVELGSPYAQGDLFEVDGPQSADVLYLFHNDYPTYALQRQGHTSWSLVEVDFQDGPWLDTNATAVTMTPAATTGLGVNVTASAASAINGGDGFLATDVGRLIRISNPASGTDWGWGRIVGVVSTTVATVDIKRAFGTTSASAVWRLGAWSDTTGYAGAATFFEQRMIAARSTDQPQTFWASETAGFGPETLIYSPDSPDSSDVWDGTVEDDDAFTWTIAAENVNAVQWLTAGDDDLVIGTAGGEWVPKATGAVLTPTDISVRRQTTHGSARVQPQRIGHLVAFLQRQKRKVRVMGFSFQVDGFIAEDATRLARHIAEGGIVEMAYQEEPSSVLWAVRSDGQLLAFAFAPEEDVAGWARMIFGGAFGTGNAACESVATIPGADGAGQQKSSEDRDEVWVIVKRTIDGSTKRYVEVLEGDFEGPLRKDYTSHTAWATAMIAAQEDAYYSDSIITYDGSAAATITGLDHLEGETVKILADGAVHPDKTVASGQITLDRSASVVQIGLGYASRYKSLKLDYGARAGTAVGKTKRISHLLPIVQYTLTYEFGPDEDNLTKYDFRKVSDTTGSPPPLFTGEGERRSFDSGWAKDPRIFFQVDDPAPCVLLGLAPEIRTNEAV